MYLQKWEIVEWKFARNESSRKSRHSLQLGWLESGGAITRAVQVATWLGGHTRQAPESGAGVAVSLTQQNEMKRNSVLEIPQASHETFCYCQKAKLGKEIRMKYAFTHTTTC